MFCTNCGSEIKDQSVFCTNCGARVKPQTSNAQPEVPDAVDEIATAIEAEPVVQPAPAAEQPVAAEPAKPAEEPAPAASNPEPAAHFNAVTPPTTQPTPVARPAYTPASTPAPIPTPAPAVKPVTVSAPAAPAEKPVSTWLYILMLLVMNIPVVGLVVHIICLAAAKQKSFKNYCRAVVILGIIALVLAIAGVVLSLVFMDAINDILREYNLEIKRLF